MSHELFQDVTEHRPRANRAAGGTLAFSIVAHALVLAAVIVVPLLATDALPSPAGAVTVFTPPVVPPPPVPAVVRARRTPSTPTEVRQNSVPVEAPPRIVDERPPDIAIVCDTCVVDPTQQLQAVGIVGGTGPALPDPPPPPKPEVQRPLRLSSVQMPKKIRDVAPVYPTIAQRAGIEGVVVIEAVIAADGQVKDARVLRSQALLDQAALDAVRAWRYEPTRVGGVAVPVIVTVTVQFRLQR